MEVKFHGVRGSAPASGSAFSVYGGDTPCVEVRHGTRRLLLDAGSGLRHVTPSGSRPEVFDLILSHYHYDHLIGLPFFEALWRDGGRLRIWAPRLAGLAPQSVLEGFYSPPYCPVELTKTPMRVEIRPYAPGAEWRLGRDIAVSTMLQAHPGGSCAIRIDGTSASLVYATDVELSVGAGAGDLARFAAGANLLIVDAMSNDAEAASRVGWGHSSWREAISAGKASGAEKIALFHHDPKRCDAAMAMEARAVQSAAGNAFFARQGAVIALDQAPLPTALSRP